MMYTIRKSPVLHKLVHVVNDQIDVIADVQGYVEHE